MSANNIEEPNLLVSNDARAAGGDKPIPLSNKAQAHNSRPKQWKCGDPYQFDIPKPEGDLYEILLAKPLRKDMIRCEAWKDEVQNLLIFAGLFSAVVTAFVVESYKGLQPDPQDMIITILGRIADRLDNPLNTSSISTITANAASFSPTPAYIRINIFWFISLVLSLTTVLVAIISLQWLREHMQYDVSLQPKEQLAIFNMRIDGFERWYVPQIFSALPLLLQAALILFFVGIAEFLLFAVPVIALISAPIFFILATTILPTPQCFALSLPLLLQINDKVPAPCPYKSPQSHIFRRVSRVSKKLFRVYSLIFASLYFIAVALPLRLLNWIISQRSPHISSALPPFSHNRSGILDDILDIWWYAHQKNWAEYDTRWPGVRTIYSRHLYDRAVGLKTRRESSWDEQAIYDRIQGFRHIIEGSSSKTETHALYHCVEELSSKAADRWKDLHKRGFGADILCHENRYFQVLLRSIKRRPFHEISHWFHFPIEELNFNVMHEENIYAFLVTMTRDYFQEFKYPFLGARSDELYIRLVSSTLIEKLHEVIFDKSWKMKWGSVGLGPFGNFIPTSMHPYSMSEGVNDSAWPVAISDQWSMIVDSIFKGIVAKDIKEEPEELDRWYTGESIDCIMALAVCSQLDDAVEPILAFITSTLRDYLETLSGRRPDFIFYAAYFYVHILFQAERTHISGLASLIPVMGTYLDYINNIHMNSSQPTWTKWINALHSVQRFFIQEPQILYADTP